MMNRLVKSGILLLAVLAFAACSRNEYSMKGPAPPAPKNPKPAQRIEKQPGTGMNAMPAPPANDQQDQAQGQAASSEQKDATVKGTVKLPPALQADFKPGETLFVIARKPGQTGAPVAAKKIVVNAFPVSFELGRADSMMGSALPDTMQILVKLDRDGNLSTNDPDDMLGGPADATLGGSVDIILRKAGQ